VSNTYIVPRQVILQILLREVVEDGVVVTELLGAQTGHLKVEVSGGNQR
jgi:hypothetical protein